MGSDLYMAGRFRAETQYGPACALLRRARERVADLAAEFCEESDLRLVEEIDAFLKRQDGPP
jgi:hypothetical protein